MPTQLSEIKDAWDKSTGDGRDDAGARALADAFVADNPELFADLENTTVEDCVKAVSVLRAAGRTEDQWVIEAWLLHRFEPQNIGGPVQAKVRITQ